MRDLTDVNQTQIGCFPNSMGAVYILCTLYTQGGDKVEKSEKAKNKPKNQK